MLMLSIVIYFDFSEKLFDVIHVTNCCLMKSYDNLLCFFFQEYINAPGAKLIIPNWGK